MPRAIQNNNKLNSIFHFALHRGPDEYASDPYSNNRSLLGIPRCSGVGYIAKLKYARISGFAALSILIILLALNIYPIVLKDFSSAEAMGTAVPSATSLTMDAIQDSAELSVTPKDTNGTFAYSETTQQAKFGVTTNNYTGYILTIEGSDDTKQLTNTNVTTAKLDSISSSIDANTFNISNSFNGKWGYQPSKYNSEANTDFLPAPTTTATTLDATSVPNDTANEYTIGLGARVDYTNPSGTYTNTFILRAVGNPAPYTINYQDATGDISVANLPTGASSSTSATDVVLSSQEPTRDGYTFKAWCDGIVNTTGVNLGTICTGTEYLAGGNFGVDQTSANTATLYAVWTPNTYSIKVNFGGYLVSSVQVRTAAGTGGTLVGTINADGGSVSELSYNNTYYLYPIGTNWIIFDWLNDGAYGAITCAGDNCSTDSNPTFTVGLGDAEFTVVGQPVYMQDLSKSMCQTLAADAALSIKDSRDNQEYTVRYIGDTCWMTKNLMYGYNASNPSSYTLTLNPATSNVTTSRTITLYDLVSQGTSTGECYGGNYDSNTGTGKGSGYANACIHSGSNDYTDGDTVWYNYVAATAGTIKNSNATDSTGDIITATESVCPKGWTLPEKAQVDAIGGISPGSDTYVSSFSPVLGGVYGDGTLSGEDKYGRWWSSTASNSAARYYLDYNGSNLYADGSVRSYARYVRCVSDEKTIADLTYMQDMNPAIAMNTADGVTATLTDRRDSKTYNIAKINGNVWMTQNLRLGYNASNPETSAINLTESDSNITFTTAEKTAGKRTLGLYDLLSRGGSGKECWGTYYSDTQTGSGGGYTNSCIHSGTIANVDVNTVWYNYALASAGSITGTSSATTATQSVCPRGWTLPSVAQIDSIGGTGYVAMFSPVVGGFFNTGDLLQQTAQGRMWGSELIRSGASGATRSYVHYDYNGNGGTIHTDSRGRDGGLYIRCVQAP